MVQLDDYTTQITQQMSEVWQAAQDRLQKAQRKQKQQHDQRASSVDARVGDRVFVYMPSLKSGPAHKLARPFKGPFRVVALHSNGAEVVPVDKPRASPTRVALNRLRWCPEELLQMESEATDDDQESGQGLKPSQKEATEPLNVQTCKEQGEYQVEQASDVQTCQDQPLPTLLRSEEKEPPWKKRLRPRTTKFSSRTN